MENPWIDEVLERRELIKRYNIQDCEESFYTLEVMFYSSVVVDKNTLFAKNTFGNGGLKEQLTNLLNFFDKRNGGK